jgi:pre-mRNA-splicing factor CDC5/CEF1
VLSAVAATPRSVVEGTPGSMVSATPGATPFRDQLNINREEVGFDKENLRKQLRSLPQPKNDFELLLPEDEEAAEEEADQNWEDDAADIDDRKAKRIAKKKEFELKKRSQPIQRALPIPKKINESYKKRSAATTDEAKADDDIKAEMYALMEWDISGKQPAEVYSPAAMQAARDLINAESAQREELDDNMWTVIGNCSGELIRHQDRFTRLASLNRREQLEALSEQFRIHQEWMKAQAKQAQKLDKRLNTKLGGYCSIQLKLTSKIEELRREQESLLTQLKTFRRLEENEEKAIHKRVNTLVEELRQQEEREKGLQKRYGELQHRKWELEQMELREKATTSVEAMPYVEQQEQTEK